MHRHGGVVIGVVWLVLLVAGCGSDATPAGGSAGSSSTPASVPAPSPTTAGTIEPQPTVPSSQAPTMSERTPDQPVEAAPTQPPSPPTTSGVVDSGLGSLTAIAVADLATRLDIDEQDVSVVSAEVLVWPDGSLGCPQPGMAYPQVQVDGFRIVLAARGLEFDYHGGGSRGPFLCEGAVG